jgi:F-type H+-transporting ATPase subunit b
MVRFNAEPTQMSLDAEVWVAIAFAIVVGILWHVGVHRKLLDAIDARSARIRRDLEEARRLRDDAKHLLAAARLRMHQSSAEVVSIMKNARAEARRIADEAGRENDEFVARRSREAEAKIAQAEVQAIAEIKAIIADAASRAAEVVLTRSLTDGVGDRLVARNIAQLRAQFDGSDAVRGPTGR